MNQHEQPEEEVFAVDEYIKAMLPKTQLEEAAWNLLQILYPIAEFDNPDNKDWNHILRQTHSIMEQIRNMRPEIQAELKKIAN